MVLLLRNSFLLMVLFEQFMVRCWRMIILWLESRLISLFLEMCFGGVLRVLNVSEGKNVQLVIMVFRVLIRLFRFFFLLMNLWVLIWIQCLQNVFVDCEVSISIWLCSFRDLICEIMVRLLSLGMLMLRIIMFGLCFWINWMVFMLLFVLVIICKLCFFSRMCMVRWMMGWLLMIRMVCINLIYFEGLGQGWDLIFWVLLLVVIYVGCQVEIVVQNSLLRWGDLVFYVELC